LAALQVPPGIHDSLLLLLLSGSTPGIHDSLLLLLSGSTPGCHDTFALQQALIRGSPE